MSELIDRVAMAMFARNAERCHLTDKWEDANDYIRGGWRALACAGIEAMRDPTCKMCAAGCSDYMIECGFSVHTTEWIWQTMVDEALK